MKIARQKLRIGELATRLNVEPFVIRFWEKEFNIKGTRSQGGQRCYNAQDAHKFNVIKSLLYDHGFTIAGAKKYIQENKFKKIESSHSSAAHSPAENSPAENSSADKSVATDIIASSLTTMDTKAQPEPTPEQSPELALDSNVAAPATCAELHTLRPALTDIRQQLLKLKEHLPS